MAEKKIEVGLGRNKDSEPWKIFIGVTVDGAWAKSDGTIGVYFMEPLEAKLLASLLVVEAEKAEFQNVHSEQIVESEAVLRRRQFKVITGDKS